VRNSQQNKSFARDKFSSFESREQQQQQQQQKNMCRSDLNLCFKRGHCEEDNHDDEEDSIAG
jgi:hypothetical protein